MSCKLYHVTLLCVLGWLCACATGPATNRVTLIVDTDANNELDDQHALAYALFNQDVFDIRGITINATTSGGEIQSHREEAERVLALCGAVSESIPLLQGANRDFLSIHSDLGSPEFDGHGGVDFIIQEAGQRPGLVVLAIGKLTNVALALAKAPHIASKIRIVWLGSNFPEPGEYNLVNDPAALNFVLDQDVPLEIVTVRYGKPSGSDAVSVTPAFIAETMAGLGPEVPKVEGRHGSTFTRFGDYSVSLFQNIELFGDPPSRALFDVVAVAIVKNPQWGEQTQYPKAKVVGDAWVDSESTAGHLTIWENFDRRAILDDFFSTMRKSTD